MEIVIARPNDEDQEYFVNRMRVIFTNVCRFDADRIIEWDVSNEQAIFSVRKNEFGH